MKNIIICFTLLLPTMAFAEVDLTYYGHENQCVTKDDLVGTTSEVGCVIQHGSGGIYLNFTNNVEVNNSLEKIIVVVGGIDAVGDQTPLQVAETLNEGGSEIYNELTRAGHSIVIATFGPKYSTKDLVDNTKAMAAAIEFINTLKEDTNNLKIAGISLGGLIARTSLTWMEHNNVGHKTDLLLTYDSPHQGAIIPMSVLHSFDYFIRVAEEVAESETIHDLFEDFGDFLKLTPLGLLDGVSDFENETDGRQDQINQAVGEAFAASMIVDNKASNQLLINNKNPNNSEHSDFYSWIEAIGGYPSKVRKVAFTNGNVTGVLRSQMEAGADNERVVTYRNEKGQNPEEIFMYLALYEDKLDEFVTQGRATFDESWYTLPQSDDFDFEKFMSSSDYVITDDVPGSSTSTYSTLVRIYNQTSGSDTDMVETAAMDDAQHTFIPTYSAIGVDKQYAYENLLDISGQNLESLSPFNKIYYKIMSGPHIDLDDVQSGQILGELKDDLAWIIPAIGS